MAKFGEYLVQKKYITQEQLDKALIIQREENELGYHRMIGYILLTECMENCSKDKLYTLLEEWKNSELEK